MSRDNKKQMPDECTTSENDWYESTDCLEAKRSSRIDLVSHRRQFLGVTAGSVVITTPFMGAAQINGSSNQTGDLTIIAMDIDNTRLERGEIILYENDWSVVGSKKIGSTGKVSWSDIDTGTYNFEVYGPKGELLGSEANITIESGKSTFRFQRDSPKVTEIKVGDGSGERSSFTVGEKITISPKVKNRSYKRPVRVKIQVDTNNDRSPDITKIRGGHNSTVVPKGGNQWYGYEYSPSSPGTKNIRVITESYMNDKWVTTDYTDWKSAFSVKGSEPEKSKLHVDVLYTGGEDPSEPAIVTVLRDGEEVAHNNGPTTFTLEDGVKYTVRAESEADTTEKTITLNGDGQVVLEIDVSSGGSGNEKSDLTVNVIHREHGKLTGKSSIVIIYRNGERYKQKWGSPTFTLENGVEYRVEISGEYARKNRTITLNGDKEITFRIGESPGTLKPSIVKTNEPISDGDTVKVTTKVKNTSSTELSGEISLYIGAVGGPDRVQYDKKTVTVAGRSSKTITLSYTSNSTPSRNIVAQVTTDGGSDRTTINTAQN